METPLIVPNFDPKNKTEIGIKKKIEIEHCLEGTIKPIKGHFVWEIDETTLKIKKADYRQDTVAFNSMIKLPAKKLVINPNCIYIPALNTKNAWKKYNKDKNQSSYFEKAPLMNLSDLKF